MNAVVEKKPLAGATSAQTAGTITTLLFSAIVIASLLLGWANRHDSLMTPEEGWGYALGIIGGSAMLLLLLYPLRKYVRCMRTMGLIKHWFRIHMILGVLGPVLVLFHANFATGALNSNLALFATLFVASSGLFGRFVYTRIHYGLYGRKASLASLNEELDANKGELIGVLVLCDAVRARLAAHECMALKPRTAFTGVLSLPLIFLHRIVTELRAGLELQRHIAAQAHERQWNKAIRRRLIRAAGRVIRRHLAIVDKCAGFQTHERLFALWHVLHLPLFIVMVITGIVHVIAVHIY
jgi:hypothetical protein